MVRNSSSSSLFACVLSLSLCTAILTGCGALKASPAKDSGFLPRADLLIEQRNRAPFNGYWVYDPEEYYQLRTDYSRVYIAPIDTSFVAKAYQSASGSERTKMQRIQEAEELAKYFREEIKMVLKEKASSLILADSPGPRTISLNIALVEVIPANPGVNFIGTAAGFFVPGGSLIKLAGESRIAMEGYAYEIDPNSALYEQYKDREGQKTSPFSLKDYQRYAHIRLALDEWAGQIVSLLTSEPNYKVEDSIPLTLNPF